jgi:hypothetical protein
MINEPSYSNENDTKIKLNRLDPKNATPQKGESLELPLSARTFGN